MLAGEGDDDVLPPDGRVWLALSRELHDEEVPDATATAASGGVVPRKAHDVGRAGVIGRRHADEGTGVAIQHSTRSVFGAVEQSLPGESAIHAAANPAEHQPALVLVGVVAEDLDPVHIITAVEDVLQPVAADAAARTIVVVIAIVVVVDGVDVPVEHIGFSDERDGLVVDPAPECNGADIVCQGDAADLLLRIEIEYLHLEEGCMMAPSTDFIGRRSLAFSGSSSHRFATTSETIPSGWASRTQMRWPLDAMETALKLIVPGRRPPSTELKLKISVAAIEALLGVAAIVGVLTLHWCVVVLCSKKKY